MYSNRDTFTESIQAQYQYSMRAVIVHSGLRTDSFWSLHHLQVRKEHVRVPDSIHYCLLFTEKDCLAASQLTSGSTPQTAQ